MKKILVFVCLFLFVLCASIAMGAPFLVTNPDAGTDYFVVNGLPTSISASNCAPDPAGTYGLKLDLTALATGSYSVTVQACSNTWGCSPASSPFSFSRPNLGAAPAGLGLAIK
jgi:hypothetical protein